MEFEVQDGSEDSTSKKEMAKAATDTSATSWPEAGLLRELLTESQERTRREIIMNTASRCSLGEGK
jgi:hypothetical protein